MTLSLTEWNTRASDELIAKLEGALGYAKDLIESSGLRGKITIDCLTECKPLEIAQFESRQECEKAAESYKYSGAVCGVKP